MDLATFVLRHLLNRIALLHSSYMGEWQWTFTGYSSSLYFYLHCQIRFCCFSAFSINLLPGTLTPIVPSFSLLARHQVNIQTDHTLHSWGCTGIEAVLSSGEGTGLGLGDLALFLALPLTWFVTLGMLLHLAVPLFPLPSLIGLVFFNCKLLGAVSHCMFAWCPAQWRLKLSWGL